MLGRHLATVRTSLDRLGIALEVGMVVRVRGEVGLYKARGSVDFTVREVDTEALMGKVAAERARLVQALVDEDLYDRQRRLPVPALPLRVGLVASPGTEGCNDFLGGLRGLGAGLRRDRRPHGVQGKDAPAMVAAAIADLQRQPSTSSSWSGAVAPRPTWPPSTRRPWPGPSPTRTCRCGRASATRATSRWPTRWPTGPASPRPSAARNWPGSPSTTGGASRRRCDWPGWPVTGSSRPTRPWPPTGGPWPRAPASSSTATATAWATGPATCARWSAARSTPTPQRLAVAALAAARAARRVARDGEVDLVRRARRLAGLPARRLEVEELRAGQRRRLLGAYDYQRQLERGYSVTRDASGAVLRSVDGLAPGRCWPPSWPTGRSSRPSPDPRQGRARTQRREATDGHTQGK